jgi:uncharacterized heparinase superfamily protein
MLLSSDPVRIYWETARHLKPIQVWRCLRGPRPRLDRLDVRTGNRAGEWKAAVKRRDPWMGGKRWRHLNQEREIKTWNDSEPEKLWLYHLHYLEQPRPQTAAWWMDENPPGRGIGWEPYPLSRRISNWVAWLLDDSLEPEFRRRVETNLATQAEWLSQSLEWRLLGNHLLVNAKALVMAGVYFDGPKANFWLRRGLFVLRRELAEQVLQDGGHFELSPMYHALVLEDVLDLVNLCQVYPRRLGAEEADWRQMAGKMLGWLEQLTHPDGQIAYFNDSVQGLAAEPSALREYAVRLDVREFRIPLGASGYVRLQAGETIVLFDAGPVGPDYQPGHGHCDLLSLEISRRGNRVISNSGVSTYEPCPRRLAERGTAAHNTLRVDGAEQSEVWSSFRVARRARAMDRRTDGQHWAEAGHDGYRRLKGSVTHRRWVEVRDGHVTVNDRLEGTGFHRAEVFWHLSPGARAEIGFEGGMERVIEKGSWCAGFGLRAERPTVMGLWHGYLPASLVTHIRFD